MDRGVFINYRAEDSHSYGALLYTELVRQFGEDRVFLDCESIPAGADFVQELLGRVRSARVLLAVIGPRWLTAADPTGRRRIDDPADWIRRELTEAFTAGVPVIPVLTEQARMPAEADLPADIARLSRCQYRRLRGREPITDLARLVADLTGLDPTLAAARDQAGLPRLSPAAPGTFTGRAAELAEPISALGTATEVGDTVLTATSDGDGRPAARPKRRRVRAGWLAAVLAILTGLFILMSDNGFGVLVGRDRVSPPQATSSRRTAPNQQPPAAGPPSVLVTGHASIINVEGFDLDTGTKSDQDTPGMDISPDNMVTMINAMSNGTPRMAVLPEAPSYSRCKGLSASAYVQQLHDIRSLHVGDHICVHTNQGRYSVITLTEVPSDTARYLAFDYVTWNAT